MSLGLILPYSPADVVLEYALGTKKKKNLCVVEIVPQTAIFDLSEIRN